MLILPIKGDRIKTTDSSEESVVTSYSGLKSEPCVYTQGNGTSVIYFSNIDEINGIKVEFNNTTKIFDSIGPLKRRIHIPQPKDIITVIDIDAILDSSKDETEVKSLKIEKTLGLIIRTANKDYDLLDIQDIESPNIVGNFNLQLFKRLYIYYFPTFK